MRDLGLEQRLDRRHGVAAGLGRIAGAVRQEDAVRLQRENLFGGRGRRHDGHRAAAVVEQAQDVALDAVIDRDDGKARLAPLAVAASRASSWSRPSRSAASRRQPAPGPCRRCPASAPPWRFSASRSNSPSGAWAMTALGMPFRRIIVVSARVSTPVRPMIPRARSQASSRPVARKLDGSDRSARKIAPTRGRRGGVDDLDVLVVDADDADMGKGEGDDLRGVGRVGQDLLVAGHRRVEADLADRRAGRADAEALDDLAARQHEHARRDAGPPAGKRPVRRGMAAIYACCARHAAVLKRRRPRVKRSSPDEFLEESHGRCGRRCAISCAGQMKEAMKSGDKTRVGALRLIMAALKDREIEARGAGKIVSRADELALLTKMVKSRQELAGDLRRGGPRRAGRAGERRDRDDQRVPAKADGRSRSDRRGAGRHRRDGRDQREGHGQGRQRAEGAHPGQMDFARASAIVKGLLAG